MENRDIDNENETTVSDIFFRRTTEVNTDSFFLSFFSVYLFVRFFPFRSLFREWPILVDTSLTWSGQVWAMGGVCIGRRRAGPADKPNPLLDKDYLSA